MAGKLGKLKCPICYGRGRNLNLRKAGRGENNRYFYFMHYDPSKKSGKRSCYLPFHKLAEIVIYDEREVIYTRVVSKLAKMAFDKTIQNDQINAIKQRLFLLLIEMGWPRRFVYEKFCASLFHTYQHLIYQDNQKRGILLDKEYKKFNPILDKILSQDFKSRWKQLKERKHQQRVVEEEHSQDTFV